MATIWTRRGPRLSQVCHLVAKLTGATPERERLGRVWLQNKEATASRSIAGTPFLAAALHGSAAGGAEVTPPLRHARGDSINIGDKLSTEAMRVTLTGSPLLRGSLGVGGDRNERHDAECGNANDVLDSMSSKLTSQMTTPVQAH